MVFLISYGSFMDLDWVKTVTGKQPQFYLVKVRDLKRSYCVIGGDWRKKYLMLGIQRTEGGIINGVLMRLEKIDLDKMFQYEKEYELISIPTQNIEFYNTKIEINEPVKMFYPQKYFLYENAMKHYQKENLFPGEEYKSFVEEAAKRHSTKFYSDYLKTTD